MSDTKANPQACDEILESWSATLAGGEPLQEAVRAHLADCADCRRAAAEMEAMRLAALVVVKKYELVQYRVNPEVPKVSG